MTARCSPNVVVTGLGVVTPLGNHPGEVLRRLRAGEIAAAPPTRFDASPFACRLCAELRDFEAASYVSEPKMLRLMSRDAQLAVAAARLALADAGVKSGAEYLAEEIGIFGAAGLAGVPLSEVTPLLNASSAPSGEFNLGRFGSAGLKSVSPLLSFKVLGNMPVCFVSINEELRGPNAIYTPWEGAGVQAIEAGIRALQAGDARCVLVGGSDVKTHELAFVSLQQLGLFSTGISAQGSSASTLGACAGAPSAGQAAGQGDGAPSGGLVPAEGAAFLVLETEADARTRGARIYAQISGLRMRAQAPGETANESRVKVLRELSATASRWAETGGTPKLAGFDALVSAENGLLGGQEERRLLAAAGITCRLTVAPKKHLGDLFAAAAPLQLGLAAAQVSPEIARVLVNCFGYGSTQAAFILEALPSSEPERSS